MKLHTDQDAFSALLARVHETTGIRSDVLEKDYYVTLMLEELAQKQRGGLKAYFKGGTALYKAIGSIRRFSEDIDITVDVSGLTRAQQDKKLGEASKRYTVLNRDASLGSSERCVVVAYYPYEPVTDFDKDDALQRFGRVMVEATSFTVSEPVEQLEIAPIIYQEATDEFQNILKASYDVTPFEIGTIRIERIFIDKLFASEAYTRTVREKEGRAFDVAKHMYDLCALADHPRIRGFLENEQDMAYMIGLRWREEEQRLDRLPQIPLRSFYFFHEAPAIPAIRAAYEKMQEQYVLNPKDRIPLEQAQTRLDILEKALTSNASWR